MSHVDLLSYRVTDGTGTRICRVQYIPGYGLISSQAPTNGSWYGLTHALYELDPKYAKRKRITVEPIDVPSGVLSAAVGFMALQDAVTRGSGKLQGHIETCVAAARLALEPRIQPSWIDNLSKIADSWNGLMVSEVNARQLKDALDQEIAKQSYGAPKCRVLFVRDGGSARVQILLTASVSMLDEKQASMTGILCWA